MVLVEPGVQLPREAMFKHPNTTGNMRAAFASIDDVTNPFMRSISSSPSCERIDFDLFSHRLERYKVQSREALERRKQRRSISPREAEEVAAAARFRLHIDQFQQQPSPVLSPRPTETEQYRANSRLREAVSADNIIGISKSRLIRVRDSQSVIRQRRSARSLPLQLDQNSSAMPRTVHNTILPARTSSRAASSICFKNPAQRTKLISNPRPTQTGTPGTQDMDANDLEHPTIPWICKDQASSPMPIRIPNQRSYVVEAGREETNQEHSVRDHVQQQPLLGDDERAVMPEQRRSRKLAQMLSVETKSEQVATESAATVARSVSDPIQHHELQPPTIGCLPRRPVPRKKKTFFGWLHKKSEVDELIDMYMSDECDKESRSIREKLGRSKPAAFRPTRSATESTGWEAGDF